jgi:hypothetical protein
MTATRELVVQMRCPRFCLGILRRRSSISRNRIWSACGTPWQPRCNAADWLSRNRESLDAILSQLTRPQISLIRSSIKAGVKPTALQRQFGLTRAQITAALKGSD